MQSIQQSVQLMLNGKRKENAFLIRILNVNPDTEVHLYNGSVAVFEPCSESWAISLEHNSDFVELYKLMKKPLGTFYVNRSDCMEEIRSVFPGARGDEYLQYVIDSERFSEVPVPIGEGVEVVELDKSWVEFILTLYHSEEFGYPEYIEQCIDINPSYGVLLNGKKAGFILEHTDGELGTIAVLPEARGHSLGKILMQAVTPAYIRQGGIGIGLVLSDNTSSNRMLAGSNYKAIDRNIIWVYH